jgi:hypothetical protein
MRCRRRVVPDTSPPELPDSGRTGRRSQQRRPAEPAVRPDPRARGRARRAAVDRSGDRRDPVNPRGDLPDPTTLLIGGAPS